MKQEKVAFVLSAGGSCGALQVGALEVLVQAGLEPDMLVGSSVGAINSATFAKNPGVRQLQTLYQTTTLSDLFSGSVMEAVIRAVRGEHSLYNNGFFKEMVHQEFAGVRFRDLALPCYLVATDLDDGSQYVFGDDEDEMVEDGLMSSTAMTPLHPPWEVNGRRYADGGLVAMLPVMEAAARGATHIVALNLANQLMSPNQRSSILDMGVHVMDILTQEQVRRTLYGARRQDNITLQLIDLIPKEYIQFDDMSRMKEQIEWGRQCAQEALSRDPHVTA